MYTLMTGSTGVVGIALRSIFEERREKIYYLIRDGNSRLDLDDEKMTGINRNQIIEGEISSRICGISSIDIRLLYGKISKIVHVAGSVKFDEALRDEILDVNVNGTKNVLELAHKIGAKEIHFVSTAYADTQRNAYEESKYEAEKLVRNCGIPFSIYRISIVIGDFETGHITDFTGFYGFFTGLYNLAEKQKQEDSNGIVKIPIYINCSFKSTLNLVPRDWLTETMFKLIELRPTGKTFYITHPNPLLVNDVMRYGFETLGISGIKYNNHQNEQPAQKEKKWKTIQKMVNKTLERYRPYVTEEKHFKLESTKLALGEDYTDPPDVTPEMLKILLNFAIKENFGKKKLKTPVAI